VQPPSPSPLGLLWAWESFNFQIFGHASPCPCSLCPHLNLPNMDHAYPPSPEKRKRSSIYMERDPRRRSRPGDQYKIRGEADRARQLAGSRKRSQDTRDDPHSPSSNHDRGNHFSPRDPASPSQSHIHPDRQHNFNSPQTSPHDNDCPISPRSRSPGSAIANERTEKKRGTPPNRLSPSSRLIFFLLL